MNRAYSSDSPKNGAKMVAGCASGVLILFGLLSVAAGLILIFAPISEMLMNTLGDDALIELSDGRSILKGHVDAEPIIQEALANSRGIFRGIGIGLLITGVIPCIAGALILWLSAKAANKETTGGQHEQIQRY